MSSTGNVAQLFAALSDPTRVAVIEILKVGPQRAGDIADTLGMSAPALSRHLRLLRQSGLITDDAVENDARVRLYRLEQAQFASLRDWLTEVETFWADQLHAFKKHAEALRQSPRKLKPGLLLKAKPKAKQRVPKK